MLKAWTAKEFFAWNGKYYQLPKVNLAAAGAGSASAAAGAGRSESPFDVGLLPRPQSAIRLSELFLAANPLTT